MEKVTKDSPKYWSIIGCTSSQQQWKLKVNGNPLLKVAGKRSITSGVHDSDKASSITKMYSLFTLPSLHSSVNEL